MADINRNTGGNRRYGKDSLSGILKGFKAASWISMFVSVVFLGMAKPQTESVYDKLHNTTVRTTWDQPALDRLLFCLMFTMCVSTAGLLLSVIRSRRGSERYPVSLILPALISFNALLAYFYFFKG